MDLSKYKTSTSTSLMQEATKQKKSPIDLNKYKLPVEEPKPGFLETPAFSMEELKPEIKTVGKEVANIGKSFLSNVVGLIKGIVMSPKTSVETARQIGESIAGAEQEGVKFGDVLKELIPSAGKVLAPEFITKGIESGKEGEIKEGIYQGAKSLAEDPFQLLPYGLMLKGAMDKGKPVESAKLAPEIAQKGLKEATKVDKGMIAQNEIVGKILQGKKTDIEAGTRALKEIDTTGVKDYSELGGRLKNQITNLAQKVDEKFDTDPTPQPLNELTIKSNVGGKIITTNYVKSALDGLKEAYEKSSDPANAERINQIIQKAETQGLSAKEVNYIAREFGTEFKGKAFNPKTGDALTSVNANAYENIRTGVKNTARQLMPDEATKALDKTITDLYNTERLVNKMTEAVNKTEQRVQKRNLGERVGGAIGQGFSLITANFFKGFLQKVLIERNLGNKSLNNLDLQEMLSKNLKALDKINGAKTEFEFIKLLNEYIKQATKENINYIKKSPFIGAGGLQEKINQK